MTSRVEYDGKEFRLVITPDKKAEHTILMSLAGMKKHNLRIGFNGTEEEPSSITMEFVEAA